MEETKDPKHTLKLDQYVPALVTFLANKLSSGASQLYRRKFGLGIVEWRLLALLKVENNISPNRMCQVIGLDKAGVSRSLKTLTQKGFVVQQVNPEDARQNLIALTPQGHDMHDAIFDVAIQREQILLETLSDNEQELLIDLLNKLNAQIDAVNAYDPDA